MTENLRDNTPDHEVKALLRVLHGQRRHVVDILDGLDAQDLRRPVLPAA
ncbi:hypothetical protein [Streptomyces sp. NPDC087859]